MSPKSEIYCTNLELPEEQRSSRPLYQQEKTMIGQFTQTQDQLLFRFGVGRCEVVLCECEHFLLDVLLVRLVALQLFDERWNVTDRRWHTGCRQRRHGHHGTLRDVRGHAGVREGHGTSGREHG